MRLHFYDQTETFTYFKLSLSLNTEMIEAEFSGKDAIGDLETWYVFSVYLRWILMYICVCQGACILQAVCMYVCMYICMCMRSRHVENKQLQVLHVQNSCLVYKTNEVILCILCVLCVLCVVVYFP